MKQKLLIISDGNGVSTDFVKWPDLLKILTTKTLDITNRSVIGASNEMILARLTDALKEKFDYAIIQWTHPQRLDIITDDFWREQASVDPIYHFNLVNALGKEWWVTSKSTNEHVRKYHDMYIRSWQSTQRTFANMLAAAAMLNFYRIPFLFSLCYKLDFEGPTKEILDTYPWAWHQPYSGIDEFRHTSKYIHYDQGLSQPHPLIGLEWIDQVLTPCAKFFAYDRKTYYNVEQHLLKNV